MGDSRSSTFRSSKRKMDSSTPFLAYLSSQDRERNLESKSHSYICLELHPQTLLNASPLVLSERFTYQRKVRCIPLIVWLWGKIHLVASCGCWAFIDISDGTLEEKLASFVSHVTLMADLFQGAKNWQPPGLSEQTAKPSLLVSLCKHTA